MNPIYQAYRPYLTALLFCAYMVGNFGVLLFETIHFISHLRDSTPQHSLDAHGDTHTHNTLNILVNLTNSDLPSDQPIPNNSDEKIKKIIQNLASIDLSVQDTFLTCNNSQHSYYQILTNQNFVSHPAPPPKFS